MMAGIGEIINEQDIRLPHTNERGHGLQSRGSTSTQFPTCLRNDYDMVIGPAGSRAIGRV